MAAKSESAGSAAPWSFNLVDALKRKFGVGPANWDRFAAAADGNDAETPVPCSGANVTLKDLARDPKSIWFPSNDDPAVRAAIEDDRGWVGTPDPTKYAPDTTHLSPRELEEEVKKGNIMLWKDFKKWVSELPPEDREGLHAVAERRMMQERMFFTMKDGSKVSVWDMLQFINNNPELQALYERGRRFPTVDPTDPGGRVLPAEPASGLERSAGQAVAVVTNSEAEDLDLDWGHVGSGAIWRRRPTRWLWGLDGLKDWDVEVYTHEPMANQVLGAKYGGCDPYQVVEDPSYARDVVRCGPLLGMTFVLTAARDLPLQEMVSQLRDNLAACLQRQAPLVVPRRLRPTLEDPTDLGGATWPRLFLEPTPQQHAEEESAGCDELGVSWRTMDVEEHAESVREGLQLLQSLPEELAPALSTSTSAPRGGLLSSTPLVDESGRTWRQGGSLWLTLEPEGSLTVQAQTRGLIGEQESYLLGRLQGHEALCGALMDAFLGPSPLDPELAATTRSLLLMPANGFTAGNRTGDPNHPIFPVMTSPPPPKAPTSPSAYRLEPVRPGGGGGGGMLLSGLQDEGPTHEVVDLLVRAAAAAADGEAAGRDAGRKSVSDSDADLLARRRRAREAAARVLREGIEQLGPDARSIIRRGAASAAVASSLGDDLIPEAMRVEGHVAVVEDLFSLARKLDGDEGVDSGGERGLRL